MRLRIHAWYTCFIAAACLSIVFVLPANGGEICDEDGVCMSVEEDDNAHSLDDTSDSGYTPDTSIPAETPEVETEEAPSPDSSQPTTTFPGGESSDPTDDAVAIERETEADQTAQDPQQLPLVGLGLWPLFGFDSNRYKGLEISIKTEGLALSEGRSQERIMLDQGLGGGVFSGTKVATITQATPPPNASSSQLWYQVSLPSGSITVESSRLPALLEILGGQGIGIATPEDPNNYAYGAGADGVYYGAYGALPPEAYAAYDRQAAKWEREHGAYQTFVSPPELPTETQIELPQTSGPEVETETPQEWVTIDPAETEWVTVKPEGERISPSPSAEPELTPAQQICEYSVAFLCGEDDQLETVLPSVEDYFTTGPASEYLWPTEVPVEVPHRSVIELPESPPEQSQPETPPNSPSTQQQTGPIAPHDDPAIKSEPAPYQEQASANQDIPTPIDGPAVADPSAPEPTDVLPTNEGDTTAVNAPTQAGLEEQPHQYSGPPLPTPEEFTKLDNRAAGSLVEQLKTLSSSDRTAAITSLTDNGRNKEALEKLAVALQANLENTSGRQEAVNTLGRLALANVQQAADFSSYGNDLQITVSEHLTSLNAAELTAALDRITDSGSVPSALTNILRNMFISPTLTPFDQFNTMVAINDYRSAHGIPVPAQEQATAALAPAVNEAQGLLAGGQPSKAAKQASDAAFSQQLDAALQGTADPARVHFGTHEAELTVSRSIEEDGKYSSVRSETSRRKVHALEQPETKEEFFSRRSEWDEPETPTENDATQARLTDIESDGYYVSEVAAQQADDDFVAVTERSYRDIPGELAKPDADLEAIKDAIWAKYDKLKRDLKEAGYDASPETVFAFLRREINELADPAVALENLNEISPFSHLEPTASTEPMGNPLITPETEWATSEP